MMQTPKFQESGADAPKPQPDLIGYRCRECGEVYYLARNVIPLLNCPDCRTAGSVPSLAACKIEMVLVPTVRPAEREIPKDLIDFVGAKIKRQFDEEFIGRYEAGQTEALRGGAEGIQVDTEDGLAGRPETQIPATTEPG